MALSIASAATRVRTAALAFIRVSVLIDGLPFGLTIPALPAAVVMIRWRYAWPAAGPPVATVLAV